MKRKFFAIEKQESICQYLYNIARRNQDFEYFKGQLDSSKTFAVGNEVRFCMTEGEGKRYFAFYYYTQNEVRENYLSIDQQGKMHLMDGTFSPIDEHIHLSFEKDQFMMQDTSITFSLRK